MTINLLGLAPKATAAAVLLAGGLLASRAEATPILVFGQQGLTTPVTGNATTVSGKGVTTISASDAAISVTAIDAPSGEGTAYLTFTATSYDAATVGTDNNIRQNYTGNFSIYTGQNRTGTNLLSGTFTDLFEGLNNSATIIASTPDANAVVFTSDVIPSTDLGVDRAISLSFTGVTPGITAPNANNTIPSFTSAISGNFSANNTVAVPEPASLGLLGLGFVAAGLLRRRRA